MPETPGLAESVYEVKGRDFLPAEVLTKPVCPAHIGPTMDLSAVAVPAVRLRGRPTCHRCAGWWWWSSAITRCGSIRRRGAAKEGTDGGRDDRGGRSCHRCIGSSLCPFQGGCLSYRSLRALSILHESVTRFL